MTLKHMVRYGKWLGAFIMVLAFPARDFVSQFAGDSTIMFGFGVAMALGTVDFIDDFGVEHP